MKNLEVKEGYLNRHLNPLPTDKEIFIKIIHNGNDGIVDCRWFPNQHKSDCLGTARRYTQLGKSLILHTGYNVWEPNNDEFIYYSVID